MDSTSSGCLSNRTRFSFFSFHLFYFPFFSFHLFYFPLFFFPFLFFASLDQFVTKDTHTLFQKLGTFAGINFETKIWRSARTPVANNMLTLAQSKFAAYFWKQHCYEIHCFGTFKNRIFTCNSRCGNIFVNNINVFSLSFLYVEMVISVEFNTNTNTE